MCVLNIFKRLNGPTSEVVPLMMHKNCDNFHSLFFLCYKRIWGGNMKFKNFIFEWHPNKKYL